LAERGLRPEMGQPFQQPTYWLFRHAACPAEAKGVTFAPGRAARDKHAV
jgi:hypothetical protein